MYRFERVTLLFLCFFYYANALANHRDTTTMASTTTSQLKITSRFHTRGMFALTGRLVSDNPVFDVNINYSRKKWGLQIFKAIDLKDASTKINFSLVAINKTFHLSDRLTVTPSAGFIIDQLHSLADKGTDAAAFVTASYMLNETMTLDFNSLFYNLILGPKQRDWVNRTRLLCSYHHLSLIISLWHNNNLFDETDYITCSSALSFTSIKLSKNLNASIGLSGVAMPLTSDSNITPKKNGLYFTVSLEFE